MAEIILIGMLSDLKLLCVSFPRWRFHCFFVPLTVWLSL